MNRSFFPQGRFLRLIGCAAVLTLVMVGSLFAQSYQSGNVYGKVLDNQNQALPGVTVTLSGVGAPRTFVTDSDGSFRFVSLSPGSYNLKAELQGFGTVSRTSVSVNVGRNTEVEVKLAPALEQTITVTAETPLLDVRKSGTGATLTQVELESIPSARDPWVVLQQVPGVTMDRINVGGNESGQQSVYVGKGTFSGDNNWALDGVNITDAAASGSSPMYYDFDAFEEMQATTGGSDPRIGSPGVGMNMVTKRGTNELKGSARYFLTDGEFQEDPEVPSEAVDYLTQVNQIDKIEDYGVEAGGPIIRDRLWLWGAYAENHIGNLVPGPFGLQRDFTLLENTNAKLNAQITASNSATAFWSLGDKIKIGRSAGPTRPPETAWNQSTPTELYKIEDTHIFSPNFFLTALYSFVDGKFQLIPGGGLDGETWRGTDNVWHDGYYAYYTERPQDQFRVDGSNFFDIGSLNNELKFGFAYQDTPVDSTSVWTGSGNYHRFRTDSLCDAFGVGPGCTFVFLSRPAIRSYEAQRTEIYVGDTVLMGNLTLQVGLRYDASKGSNLASTVPANSVAPELLPAVKFPGDATEFDHNAISPRIGATYSLGSTRRTLIKGSYNQYAGTVNAAAIGVANPFYYVSGFFYIGQDLNSDKKVQRNEVRFDLGYLFYQYVDPADPGAAISTTRLDPNLDPSKTQEFIIGVEHELLPEFTVGVNFTHRTATDLAWLRREKTRGSGNYYTSADYQLAGHAEGETPNGDHYSIPYYELKPGIAQSPFSVYTNRPDYEQQYDGLELVATKRLSNRWMMRGNLSWNDWTQEVGPGGIQDPTEQRTTGGCSSCDGEIIFQQSLGSGAKEDVFINSGWSYNLTGLYQLPWQISLGASLTGREGYPTAYIHDVYVENDNSFKPLLIPGVDDRRYENVKNLDLRVAKEFRFMDRIGFTVSADVFNVTDERPVLQRDSLLYDDLGSASSTGNNIREMQSPRVIRFGARFAF